MAGKTAAKDVLSLQDISVVGLRGSSSQSPTIGASPGDLRSAEQRGRETLTEPACTRPTFHRYWTGVR